MQRGSYILQKVVVFNCLMMALQSAAAASLGEHSPTHQEMHTMAQSETDASRDLTTIGDQQYFFSSLDTFVDAAEAAQRCAQMRMKLLSLETEEENSRLMDFLVSNKLDEVWYWTSGSRQPGSQWMWSNGEPLNFTDWFTGQPNAAHTEQACLYVGGGWGWWDERCGVALRFVCEA